MAEETVVLIVGAGPAGLATAACLNLLSIPNIVLEREDCCASMWKKRSYKRLKLHLAKQFCQLPHMPFPSDAPTFVSKNGFIHYLDTYAARFNVQPLFARSVESVALDEGEGGGGGEKWWRAVARNVVSGEEEVYVGRFLVVATGENSEGFVPKIQGLEGFGGEVIHSCQYVSGDRFSGKDVLVVGSGNSGMEIAFDLSNCGARAAISVRSPEMVQLGMSLLKFIPCNIVDTLVVGLSKLRYGDFSNYGLQMASKGPFYLKRTTGRSPTIDVGTMDKIRTGKIPVFPAMINIKSDGIEFANGKTRSFDAIVFATGYKSTVRKWLKWKGNDNDDRGGDGGVHEGGDVNVDNGNDGGGMNTNNDNRGAVHVGNISCNGDSGGVLAVLIMVAVKDGGCGKVDGNLFNEEGMPKQRHPDHWKGENGLYCVGFASAGLFGISNDAQSIAKDINSILSQKRANDG
ncbi:monooxygenase [Sarracenia purpurea var. burkii]